MTPTEPPVDFNDQPFRVGEWRVEPMLDQVTRGSETHRLEPRTMRVLVRLAQTPGKVVSSEELLDSAWSGVIVSPASVYQAISQLRKLLGDSDETPRYIATVPRRGYRLVATVTMAAAESTAVPDIPVTPAPAPATAAEVPVEARAPVPLPAHRLRWPWIASAAALAAALGATLVAITLVGREPASTPVSRIASDSTAAHTHNALVVLPFETEPNPRDKHLVTATRLMLFERFSAIPALPVIGSESSQAFALQGLGVKDAQRVLHARFVLGGRVTRNGDRLSLEANLYDAASGAKLWSKSFDRPTDELTALREEIVQGVITTVGVDGKTRSEASRRPIRFDAYELYAEGDQLILPDSSIEEIDKAASIFSRSTALDPFFARGYVSVGKALMYRAGFVPGSTPEVIANALQAYDRALELDPGLGDAWMQRASIVADPKQAEEQFRKGLALAPNYTVGSMFYASFLSSHGRVGEASEILSRALESDPYSPTLHVLTAMSVMEARSDVDQAQKHLATALEIYPNYDFAVVQRAYLEHEAHGMVANALRVLDQPERRAADRPSLALMYLEVDDPDAAQDVWSSPPEAPPGPMPAILLYRGDTHAAAEVGRKLLATPGRPALSLATLFVRDDAVANGDYASAITLIEPIYLEQKENWTRANADRVVAENYASLLILAGRRQEGEYIARTCLSRIEADAIGRPPHWFAYESARMYALLGDDERALAELAAGQKLGLWNNWWYITDHDPVFAHLRHDPRFRALADAAKKHRLQQRALVDEMRRKGEIPRRGVNQSR